MTDTDTLIERVRKALEVALLCRPNHSDSRDALVALTELAERLEAAEAELKEATQDEIAYFKRAEAAERERDEILAAYRSTGMPELMAQRDELVEALERIQQRQPEAVAEFRKQGIVFDRAPNGDPSDWQNIAFWVYTELCENESVARAALAKVEGA